MSLCILNTFDWSCSQPALGLHNLMSMNCTLYMYVVMSVIEIMARPNCRDCDLVCYTILNFC